MNILKKLTSYIRPKKTKTKRVEKKQYTDSRGLKEVMLEYKGIKTLPKTVCPDSWNQVDYVRYLKEAYENRVETFFEREGLYRIRGIDSNRIVWEMFLEFKDNEYKLITGFPIL